MSDAFMTWLSLNLGKKTLTRLLLGLLVLSAPAIHAEERDASWGKVVEPEFGEILYQFYQNNYYTALTHLLALKKTGKLSHHSEHAELLLGGMYLSYGMDEMAGDIFKDLLAKGIRPEVQDRAWYYVGKFRYQRDYLTQAQEALLRVKTNLPYDLQEERSVLLANIYMTRGQYDQAINSLDQLGGKSPWTAYGLYNLGVALIKAGQHEKGIKVLSKMGKMPAEDTEMKALRDRANLALGYTYLQTQSPQKAMNYMEKVSLEGLLSNKALLGVGWAHSALGKQKKALVYWTELQQRNVMDAAVQESLLAVPYAFGKLRAYRQAIEQYEQAVKLYENELDRLDGSIRAIRSGELTRQLIKLDIDSEKGWFWSPQNLPDTPASYYLSHLLSSHQFQEALKNYRDLRYMQSGLQQQMNNIDLFNETLRARRQVYNYRLPRIKRKHRILDIALAEKERERLAQFITINESSNDVLALATSKENEQLQRLDRIERKLRKLRKTQEFEDYSDRHRRLKGMLLWQVSRDYKPRMWHMKKGIKQLDMALYDARKKIRMFERLQEKTPSQLNNYGNRIMLLRRHFVVVQTKVNKIEIELDQYLQKLAIASLRQQQQRLRTYLVQARFSIAQLIDKSLQTTGGK